MSEFSRTSKESEVVIDKLQQLLADYHVHYMNLRGFHWNLRGPQFFTLHAKFEEFYNEVALKIDEVAERLRALGAKPEHRFSAYIERSSIREAENTSEAEAALRLIHEGNEHLLRSLRSLLEAAAASNDTSTDDIFTAYISELEKQNWMLRAQLGVS